MIRENKKTLDDDEASDSMSQANGAMGDRGAYPVTAIVTYAICSVGMILMNKMMTAKYKLIRPVQLLMLQSLAGTLLGFTMKRTRMADIIDLDAKVMIRWLPLSCIFVAMLGTSLMSLSSMSMAMYTLLKNGAMFLTAIGDVYIYDRKLSSDHILAFYLMGLGSVLSTGVDRWITTSGLVWTTLNILFTAGYNLYLKKFLSDHKEYGGHWVTMYYNNLLSLPLLLPFCFGGLDGFVREVSALEYDGKLSLFVFTVAGALLSVSSLFCLHETTPTTYTVVGATCKIPNIILGAIIFDQYPTKQGVLGIVVAFAGIFLYTSASIHDRAYHDAKKKNACETPPEDDLERGK
eukprot:TRINITY_DN19126_c0_g1_i1.p1 TRINITY_DN19126_c0_g1~~TRINITY_DN19126_c0_g1_i1.p1  ORF type:complete len:348 (+),score=45.27 TRINITY_DN19126_c0_g1_i1:102-1145(+)